MDKLSIRNRKYLNKNNYSLVEINNDCVRYRCDQDYNTIESNTPFINTIKNLSNEEQINEIIRHFLRNTNLESVEFDSMAKRKKCDILRGSRTMLSYIPIKEELRREILLQYYNERYKKVLEENYNRVRISFVNNYNSCYRYHDIDDLLTKNDGMDLYISLCQKEYGKLIEEDRKFIEWLVPFLMGSHKGNMKKIGDDETHIGCLGYGIGNINHDIVAMSSSVETTLYYIWCAECSKREKDEQKQLSLKLN